MTLSVREKALSNTIADLLERETFETGLIILIGALGGLLSLWPGGCGVERMVMVNRCLRHAALKQDK